MTSQERQLKKQTILDYMRLLPVKKYASANAGISRKTLDIWLEKDKDFYTRFQIAQATFFSEKTKKAKPEFLLERLDPETFGKKDKLEITDKSDPVAEILRAVGLTGGTKE